ncbi:MAG: glycosyltransferase family 4 protein [Segetibacter sp.]|nr:glycosyltransferase family 4 protein [Segetibacter sp.]
MSTTTITFTVINDLTYDQRMKRICTSLSQQGYHVKLVGRKLKTSVALVEEPYRQKRLNCFFSKGKAMYLEFNLRLLFHLLFSKTYGFCAIDLDTILPCYIASTIRGKRRVYDAHELFTEQKEIVIRPSIQKLWLKVERFAVPKFELGYTVNKFIADEFYNRYGVKYEVVKNMPVVINTAHSPCTIDRFIIYQGAVNEGRSFETLIPAMKMVDANLVICGEGNFFEQAKRLVKQHKLEKKVELRGYVPPAELKLLTPRAFAAITLFENVGLNQYHSLANRFFDYIMAGVPQVCVGYPEYEKINDEYGIAYLIYKTDTDTIAAAFNNLLGDEDLYKKLEQNCLTARQHLNWSTEEQVLVDFYKQKVFSS